MNEVSCGGHQAAVWEQGERGVYPSCLQIPMIAIVCGPFVHSAEDVAVGTVPTAAALSCCHTVTCVDNVSGSSQCSPIYMHMLHFIDLLQSIPAAAASPLLHMYIR